MATKSNKKATDSHGSEYNGWRVLAIFIEGLFGLINTNKIYPAFGLAILAIATLIVWRVPATELAVLIRFSIEQISSTSSGLMGLLIISNGGWIWLFNQSRSLYKSEIDRLANIRQELLQGNVANIDAHQSSQAPVPETYFLPTQATKK